MARFLIVGPPGAGKGTHSASIAERFGIPAISTGAMFRAEIGSDSALGRQINELVSSGALVPDDLTNQVVASRLSQQDAANGWLLDGYPRTLDQVVNLDALLATQNAKLDAVIMLDVPPEEVIKRLVKRAQIEGRVDDTPEVIAHRQDVYEEQTAPVVAEYESRGIVLHVDASGTIPESAANLKCGLDGLVLS
ncbi:MAG: adenylate kinase [Propionibacteriaceae bacterium]|nr:adenylate kinase [Propionibacteriaceae bacterium]